jgi:nucleoside-diphosphate-sugar epimerase
MTTPRPGRPPEPSTPTRVFVTGAGGFAGFALALSLARRGQRVRGLVHSPARAAALAAAGVEAVAGDVRDASLVREALEGVDVVYHLAAVFRRAGVPDSEYHSVHVDATRQLVEASADAGVRRVVHCSTVGVHGDVNHEEPVAEDAPFNPMDIYQQTKLEGEWMARETARRTGIPLTVVRPSPIYGPGDRRLVKLIGGIAKRRFWLVGDGSPHFQMVYIDDLVEGFRLAAETPGAAGRTYIISGSEAPTLQELVTEIADVAQVPPPRLRLPLRPFAAAAALCERLCVPLRIEPPIYRRRVSFFTSNRWFDTTRAGKELGYVPRMRLHSGLQRTLSSYRRLGWV